VEERRRKERGGEEEFVHEISKVEKRGGISEHPSPLLFSLYLSLNSLTQVCSLLNALYRR
jgi:hypothetical protein